MIKKKVTCYKTIIIVLLALALGVSGSVQGEFKLPGSDGNTGDAGQGKADDALDISELAAENDNLQLYYEQTAGQIRIINKHNKLEWSGVPVVDGLLSNSNKAFVEAPVLIKYTEGSGITQTYPSKEKAEITAQAIDNGVRLHFNLTAMEMEFSVEYVLNETGFEVHIPYDSIVEHGRKKLLTLEVLPFFGAGTEKDEGAVFIPDGSGALIAFKENARVYYQPYSEYIYGGDPAFLTKVSEQVTKNLREKVDYGPREFAALPVYGIYKKQQGFVAIVTEGDYNAKINAFSSGAERGLKLFRSAAEFVYRNDDLVFIGRSGEVPMYQRNMAEGDRSVRYVLLDETKSNYVGMAHVYREYLINEKGLKPVQDNQMKFQLRLFGGIKRKEIIGSTFIAMTSFEQARSIIEEFVDKGINSMEVTFDGWSDDGVFGNQPSHFPAESKIGGNRELKKLAAYAKDKGIKLYLKTNYMKAHEESDEIWAFRDSIRGLNKEVMPIFETSIITRQPYSGSDIFYYLKPERIYKKYVSKEAETFADLGVQGVHLGNMGNTLYSDQDPDSVYNRQQTAEKWIESLKYMREHVGSTAVDYGFAYTLGHVDRIDNIPIDSSHYALSDGAVPFFQIAVHGLIPYTAPPSNFMDHPRMAFLRTIEYGALPSYELTYHNSSLIKRSKYNRLFSTDYSSRLEPSIDEYKKAYEVLGGLMDQKITNHEKLQENVYATTYENGQKIIINYNRKPIVINNHTIEAHGYAVEKGGQSK
jgi:hypothetical protein